MITAALCLASCVYPYEAELPEVQASLAVEGDICLGSESAFAISLLQPLDVSVGDATYALPDVNSLSLRVESESGEVYPGTFTMTDKYSANFAVDTRTASAEGGRRYRVCVDYAGESYSSDWTALEGSCVIDNLNYSVSNEILNACVSLHSDDGSNHFRYRYDETWEYHSQLKATVYFDPETYNIFEYFGGANSYYCWNTNASRGINLATTEDLEVNVLENYPVLSFHKTDRRLSMIYRLDLEVYPVSEASYRYYEHLKQVSNFNGSLFAPIPSEMPGNLHCDSDESVPVYGYVAVVQPSSARLYIDNEKTHFYEDVQPRVTQIQIDDIWEQVRYFTHKNYVPVNSDPMQGTWWAERRCVDCRMEGGNKNKPADWPNNHK